MRRLLDKLLPLFLILSGLFISCSDDLNYSNVLPVTEYPNRTSDFTLWQLAQFNGDSQMGYIIRTDDAKLILSAIFGTWVYGAVQKHLPH